MDLHLQNLRTGETLPLDPTRTLIGTARYADVRTGDGPYLAAVAVRYPSGWVLHGLSDDPGVRLNGEPLRVGGRTVPRHGGRLDVGSELFRFAASGGPPAAPPAAPDPPHCSAYILSPDGMEECRVVDHDLLFGRLSVCHVQYPDSRLSRVSALLAAHAGEWYIHALAKRPIVARNRELLAGYTPVEDGDELLIGPLTVRIELRAAADPIDPPSTDIPAVTFDAAASPDQAVPADAASLLAAGRRLDRWLKGQTPTPPPRGGLGAWLGAQRLRLSRFWHDTPETTAARGLRTTGRFRDAFAILEQGIRSRPDSPGLLRELYRLYEAAGLTELCYRPLRQIEKLASARGAADPWVLETLARLCERLSLQRPEMFDRAIGYWNELEAATGVSYARERAAFMATRALREGGYAGTADGGGDAGLR
jgi:hypothetical protein